LGKFWMVLKWKVLVYFMPLWYVIWPFGTYILGSFVIFWVNLVYFGFIWYIFSLFGIFFPIWYIFPYLVYCTKKNLATLLMGTHWHLFWGQLFCSWEQQPPRTTSDDVRLVVFNKYFST
jgi:hypothetical protein